MAIALWQYSVARGGVHVEGLASNLKIIDYQTPLKARQADSRVGKIDLLGLIDERLAVVELKAEAGSDSPLRALLEGLAYCAIVEANQADFAAELAELGNTIDVAKPPCLIVCAPKTYWARWRCSSGVTAELFRLTESIADHLDVGIHFFAIQFDSLEKGLGGLPPRLLGPLSFTALRVSKLGSWAAKQGSEVATQPANDELQKRLLSPSVLHSVKDVRENSKVVPTEPGIYAWWFSVELPGVPIEKTLLRDGLRLLYVGIAPARAPRGDIKPRTLRDRLKNHCRGPIASSTLRRSLACLLAPSLGFEICRTPSGKLRMASHDEARLTEWMDSNARLSWTACPEPWFIEDALIRSGPRLPLNIRGSLDPFGKTLKGIRSRTGQARLDSHPINAPPRT